MAEEKVILMVAMIALILLAVAALIRAMIGPRFTDRIVAVNAISTLILAEICLMSLYLEQDFLLDVALIYAMLSFVANVILMRILIVKRRVKMHTIHMENGEEREK